MAAVAHNLLDRTHPWTQKKSCLWKEALLAEKQTVLIWENGSLAKPEDLTENIYPISYIIYIL